ncbi:hypothetical protein [Nocardia wallacei]|uniref:Uncharacterized protein n=1 Tax=Nocardia wallacei TaxID=480035 RepID=A0A7G1KT79_9NOCA|nr:hypothetical protein [Nocardia wallacei]BCK58370.1 hypothetical protein NWFMUON74_61420 [Nocardia wallacei]
MFGLTFSRRLRTAGALLLAVSVLLAATSVVIGWTSHAHARDIAGNACIGIAALAVAWRLLRPSARARDLLAAHTALLRWCAETMHGRTAAVAFDPDTNQAIYVRKARKAGCRSYLICVGKTDDDWTYDPESMRNVHFLTATFYYTSPGVADLRKYMEAASLDGNEAMVMEQPGERETIRGAFRRLREHRDLMFATPVEAQELVALLKRVGPFTTPKDE